MRADTFFTSSAPQCLPQVTSVPSYCNIQSPYYLPGSLPIHPPPAARILLWFTIWALHPCLQFTTKRLGIAFKPLHGWILTRTDAVWVLSSWPVPQYRCTTGDNRWSEGMSSDAGLVNWSITMAAANTWHTCWPLCCLTNHSPPIRQL
jgi:hypothetical protein